MKIDALVVTNFRGISRIEARDLTDTVVVAGQNGSGKSCIFDAIRLLKSAYGGYQYNEWQQFFGEFAIQLHGGAKNLHALFNDDGKTLAIECYFRLRDHERAYITENAAELLEQTIWQTLIPEAFQWGPERTAMFSNQFRERQPEVTEKLTTQLPELLKELAKPQALGKIEVTPKGEINTADSLVLAVAFANYRPRQIGVIDFHGAQRHYGRENVHGINLSLDQSSQKYSQHILYNYNDKYKNVKSEMAGNFVKELLAEKASEAGGKPFSSLSETLKELFEVFFPDKRFLGPRPTLDGSLSFPVVTQSGSEHDLDELSSGEKEILYGYLRIRSSAPRDSIILLDEPELHLNPRLIRGLPEFYRRHLGEALQNQLWLVTHSDALIREAVGKPEFSVFHMLSCGSDGAAANQLRRLTVTQDLEMVLADLVGDLAAYRPGGKGLIFEGGGDTDFDKTFTAALFGEELRGINLLSGTNKIRVKLLHEILDRAYARGDLPTKFYAVVDNDSEEVEEKPAVNRFQWDVYHIENYLLDAPVIADVLNSLKLKKDYNAESVSDGLDCAARKVVSSVLIHRMRSFANARIVGSIDLGFAPGTLTIGRDLHVAASRSLDRIKNAIQLTLSESELVKTEQSFRNEIEQSFSDGSWIKKLPGREILRQYVALESVPVAYEILRNLIVSRMAELGIKPVGMKTVIDKIRFG